MNCFHNRPLALTCVLFAICSIIGSAMPAKPKLLIAVFSGIVSFFLLVLFLIGKKGRKRTLLFLFLTAVSIALTCSYLHFQHRYERYHTYVDQAVEVEGIVLERSGSAAFYSTLEVSVDRIDREKAFVNATVYFDHATPLQVGDRFVIKGTAVDPAAMLPKAAVKNFFAQGNLLYLNVEGSENVTVVDSKGSDIRTFLSQLNLRLSYDLCNRIEGEEGGLACALLLGNRTWIEERTTLDFRRSGASHLLALSGLHVSILIGFAEWLLRRLHLSKTVRALCMILLSFGYLAITGFSPSTWRAVLMCFVLYSAFFASSQYDALTALCLVLAVILMVTPYAVLDASVWMSFLATASILLFSPICAEWLQRIQSKQRLPISLYFMLSGVLSTFVASVVASLGLMLYSSFVFGEVSFASVPASILLALPVTVLLTSSLILFCFPFLPLLPQICAFLSELILSVVRFFSDIPNVMMPATGLETRICLALLTAFLAFLAVAKLKRRLWALPIPILLAATVLITSLTASLSVQSLPIVLEAGHGEVRLYASEGEVVLVNDTRGNASEAYEIKLSANANYCTEIDDLVFCRFYNQATYFISRLSSVTKVRSIHLPRVKDARERAIANRLEQEAQRWGIEVVYDAELILAKIEE